MMTKIIEEIQNKIFSYTGFGDDGIECYNSDDVDNFINLILGKLIKHKKQSDLEKQELLDALIESVNENRIKDYETVKKFVELIKKHTGKTWEDINAK